MLRLLARSCLVALVVLLAATSCAGSSGGSTASKTTTTVDRGERTSTSTSRPAADPPIAESDRGISVAEAGDGDIPKLLETFAITAGDIDDDEAVADEPGPQPEVCGLVLADKHHPDAFNAVMWSSDRFQMRVQEEILVFPTAEGARRAHEAELRDGNGCRKAPREKLTISEGKDVAAAVAGSRSELIEATRFDVVGPRGKGSVVVILYEDTLIMMRYLREKGSSDAKAPSVLALSKLTVGRLLDAVTDT